MQLTASSCPELRGDDIKDVRKHNRVLDLGRRRNRCRTGRGCPAEPTLGQRRDSMSQVIAADDVTRTLLGLVRDASQLNAVDLSSL